MESEYLLMKLIDAKNKHSHYVNKGWYRIANRYLKEVYWPLEDRLQELNENAKNKFKTKN